MSKPATLSTLAGAARRLCGGASLNPRVAAATHALARPAAPSVSALPPQRMLRAAGFHHSAWAAMPERLQIVVPSMGDSITEGTICTVLKAGGEAVQEDEVIAQIETDKVTVDVRAPKTGFIHNMLVREDETVVIGQTLAFLEPSEAGAEAEAVDPAAGAQAPEPAAAPSAPGSGGGRKASIHFPPRMTPDGRRVSSLPAEEAAAFLASAEGGRTPVAPPQPPPAAASPESDAPPKKVQAPAGKRQTVTDTDGGVPERYPYSEKEMECIMLGGAGMVDVNVTVSVNVTL